MANTREPFLEINDLSGGLNTRDSPHHLADNQLQTCTNLEYLYERMPRGRRGFSVEDSSAWGPAGDIIGLFTHTPAGEDGLVARELWGVSDDPEFGRWSNGWAQVTIKDSLVLTAHKFDVDMKSFNNKLFQAYNSDQARLHLWDGSAVRRAGLATPAQPALPTNVTAGSYPATLRYYKFSYAEISGSDVIRRSELSPSRSFTPSGSHTYARIANPAAISEGETHWEIWVSADDANYFLLTTQLMATGNYDDNADPLTYTGTVAPITGTNTVPPSCHYLAVAENRLFMARDWDVIGREDRVYFTPVLGSSGIGDDERVPTNNYVDIDPSYHGPIQGIHVSPMGDILVWKVSALYRLVPTRDVLAPYTVIQVSGEVGLIDHNSIVDAVDATGAPVVAWMSRYGPYQYGPRGVEYLGAPVDPEFSFVYYCHGVYYQDHRQIWWWLNKTGNAITGWGGDLLVYNVQLRNWSKFAQPIGKAFASAMYADSNVAGVTGISDKPYASLTTDEIVKCDTNLTDDGAAITTTLETKAYRLRPMSNMGVTEVQVVQHAVVGTWAGSLIGDFGLQTTSLGSISFAPADTESLVIKSFEGAQTTHAQYVSLRLSSTTTPSTQLRPDTITLRVRPEDVRSGNRPTI